MSVRGITTITLLKSRVSQEDTLCSLGGELVLSKCESMNKTSTVKDTRRKEIKRLGKKKEGMGDLVMQYRLGHTINQVTGCKNSIPPKTKKEHDYGEGWYELSQQDVDFYV